jgi:Domain of unknown function (DUF4234)
MSLLTIGIYDVYWMYRHWKRIRERTGERLSPSWRAFLAPFYAFSLFARVKRDATELGIPVSWNPFVPGVAYLLLNAAWVLPTPWLFASFVAFLPLLPVADVTRAINARAGSSEGPNDRYSLGNLLGMIAGGFVLAILVAASLMGY